MKTDSQGNIDIPIQVNTDDLTDNLYLIVETGTVKGVVEEAYPMIVNVPELNGSDDQYFNYDVHVYPKNYFQLNSAELDKKTKMERLLPELFLNCEKMMDLIRLLELIKQTAQVN